MLCYVKALLFGIGGRRLGYCFMFGKMTANEIAVWNLRLVDFGQGMKQMNCRNIWVFEVTVVIDLH